MATAILLRHARSTANGSGVLAGRRPGVGLAERGAEQAAGLVARLAGVPVDAVVTSPLERCRQTLAPLLAERGLAAVEEPRLAEVEYGEWTGKEIRHLLDEPLWQVVQQHPSAAVFPGGEGLAAVQARAVAAIRAHDARVTAEFGPRAVWVACSHGDVIKAVLADALGVHLDGFQRIVVDPASLSVVQYTRTRPFVLRVNDNGGDLSGIVPPPEKTGEEPSSDAVVGGTTGA
ncbi:histidine phosphatase family protein [Saccharothrix algeriensis]|uniref:MSMEG_4193 family putative phosphomutase n=1 Tax=Saccharothrix algeriensis TaxID=173560 RepID=A0A8T8HYS6_9PSEU|nr:histidine phosphatase family protein [Saccharothrix algeriensis]MBM7809166.1 putative phosphomutase (TIGR03848 family) [Saccharothrix algeriensis]QTR03529.1 MSMEG_4193 family putative phosphomutase [Saccharothrix algeriensis]